MENRKVLDPNVQGLYAFMNYLREKAVSIGMTSSIFGDPDGNSCNLTTTRDVANLLIYANAYEGIRGVWSQKRKELTILGPNARTLTVESTVILEELERHYHILGGKTGLLGKTRNLAAILEIPGSADKMVVVALGADGNIGEEGNRHQAVREIADAALIKYKNPSADNSGEKVCCTNAIAYLLPAGEEPAVLFEKNADALKIPASITKVLTAICCLDILGSLDAEITYKQFDITVCPWNTGEFLDGDRVTLEHALYALLLPSNDVTAFAVARCAGEALLQKNA